MNEIDLLLMQPAARAEYIKTQEAKVSDYMLASATMKIGGMLMDGFNAFAESQRQSEALTWNASQIVQQSMKDAASVRKRHDYRKGANLLAMQQQGMQMDSGTAQVLLDEAALEAEQDVQAVILHGKKAAIQARLQARAMRQQGEMAMVGSLLNAAGAAYGYKKGG